MRRLNKNRGVHESRQPHNKLKGEKEKRGNKSNRRGANKSTTKQISKKNNIYIIMMKRRN